MVGRVILASSCLRNVSIHYHMGSLSSVSARKSVTQSDVHVKRPEKTDNIRKAPRMMPRQDFSAFHQDEQQLLSPQLTLVTFQFLSTSVMPFQDKYISETVLKKLIKQNISVEIHPDSETKYIYKEGVACDYFVLILEGHVEVEVGNEKLVFQGGPFSSYGVQALKVDENMLAPNSSSESIYVKQDAYIPDFSMKATENILFLRVRRSHYIVARRATLMGRSKHATLKEEEVFTKEWKKVDAIANATNNSGENMESNELMRIGDRNSKPVIADIEWTPLPSSASIHEMIKRADSSSWSSQAWEKHADTESEHEVNKLDISKTSTEEGNEIPALSHVEGSYKDRTSIGEVAADHLSVTFSNSNDEEVVAEEITPLVSGLDHRNTTADS